MKVILQDKKKGIQFSVEEGRLLDREEAAPLVEVVNQILKPFGALLDSGSIYRDRLYLGAKTLKDGGHLNAKSFADAVKKRLELPGYLIIDGQIF